MNIIEVTTDTGFNCEIDRDKLDDWEFTEAVVAASKDSAEAIKATVYMVNHMMSAEDAARLKEHVRGEDGRVPTTRMMEEFTDIFNKVNLKN